MPQPGQNWSWRGALAAAGGLLAAGLLSAAAMAIINPKFTPLHLVRDSDLILHGALGPGAADGEWVLEGATVLKGTAQSPQVLSAASFREDQRGELRHLLKPEVGAVLFARRVAPGPGKAFVHVGGRWISAEGAGPGTWRLIAFDQAMDGTYAGGSDMLAEMSRYLIEDPGAGVPSSAGMAWSEWIPVARLDGPIAGLESVQIGGKRCLWVASPAGDRLFAPAAREGGEAMTEIAADVGLDTRSRQYAWMDMDLDGRSDLVTWDGAAIAVRLLSSGKADRAEASRTFPFAGPCLGIAPAGLSPRGRARLLVSTEAVPRLLEWSAAEGWAGSELSRPKPSDAGGKPSACIVADLDGDGFVDVLQPRERLGLLWSGRAAAFAEPAASPVRSADGKGRFALGDFDGDGFLDVFVAGPDGNELWENDGKAGFRAVLAHSGSLAYKADFRVSAALAADLNHDGRPDLALGSADAGFVYHFSRGYRCFGEQGELRLNEVPEVPNLPSWGVQALAVGDFNDDDADDLAVAFAGGEIHCYYSGLINVAGCRVSLAKRSAGPVTVSAWQGAALPVCTGTWTVSRPDEAVRFSVRHRGNCVLKYTLPGRPAATRTLQVGLGLATVVLE